MVYVYPLFVAPKDTFTKACKVSKKATRRVYSHGKAQVDRIVVRSAEAMKKLNFTVDLVCYVMAYSSLSLWCQMILLE